MSMNSFTTLFESVLEDTSSLFEGWKDVYKQFVETDKVPEDVFQQFRKEDPSKTNKYLLWMCKQYILNPERSRHIIDVVKLFDSQIKRGILKGKEADIYKHDLNSADEAAQQVSKKKTKTQVKREVKSESVIVDETDDYLIVVPESHAASCFYGANTKWCTSAKTANYWKRYWKENAKIYIIIDKRKNKKYAAAVYPNGKIECFDEQDNPIPIETIEKAIGVDFLLQKTPKITEPERQFRVQKQIDEIIATCTKNPDGTYSTDGDINLSGFGIKQLPVKFKYVGSNFFCFDNKLITLEGAPQKIGGDFICNENKLRTLEGAPQEVGGSFYCDDNQLTSLEGAPQEVGGGFSCSCNKLTTLKGAPRRVVGGYFNCSRNKLTVLKGAPQEVSGGFYCNYNQLTTLEGAPQEVGGSFYCNYNQLTTLKGAPRKVKKTFYCGGNPVSRKQLLATIGR